MINFSLSSIKCANFNVYKALPDFACSELKVKANLQYSVAHVRLVIQFTKHFSLWFTLPSPRECGFGLVKHFFRAEQAIEPETFTCKCLRVSFSCSSLDDFFYEFFEFAWINLCCWHWSLAIRDEFTAYVNGRRINGDVWASINAYNFVKCLCLIQCCGCGPCGALHDDYTWNIVFIHESPQKRLL